VSLPLDRLAWPLADAAAALRELARRSGVGVAPDAPANAELPPGAGPDELPALGRHLGLELVPATASWAQAQRLLCAGPAVLPLPAGGGVVALLRSRRGRARLLTPELRVVEVSAHALRDALEEGGVRRAREAVDRDLAVLAVPESRRARARDVLLAERLGTTPVIRGWILRPVGSRSLVAHAREAGVTRALGAMGLVLFVQYAFTALAWVFLAQGALAGRVDPGWLVAWGMALVVQVVAQGQLLWIGGQLSLRAGGLIKRTMLLGAMRGDLDAMRSRGIGGLVGRAIESEAFESLALNGGMRVLIGAWEIVVGLGIAAYGAGGGTIVLIGLATLLVVGVLGVAYHRAHARWTEARLDLTGDLVERMVGHRTRLAQERPEAWHKGEDASLSRYVDRSRPHDALSAWLAVWPRRAFMVLGLMVLGLSASAGPVDPIGLGLGLAGVLLVARALEGLSGGVAAIAGAAVARRIVDDLLIASRRPEQLGALLPPPRGEDAGPDQAPSDHAPAVVELAGVGYAYPGRERPALADVNLTLDRGDRVLLEGASGSGKSTLAAVLAGLRAPTRGLALLRGLDLATHGERGWRRRAVAAPQFHDNRVIAGTMAFNLLLGRGGELTPEALAEAYAICEELGLGPLVARMPSGLSQQVGESGWQLSHGEKSRLYLARALLQGADLILLDETFGALDPDSQRRALACALARSKTLVVIAHP